jgi:hypothetical protein
LQEDQDEEGKGRLGKDVMFPAFSFSISESLITEFMLEDCKNLLPRGSSFLMSEGILERSSRGKKGLLRNFLAWQGFQGFQLESRRGKRREGHVSYSRKRVWKG